MPKTPKSDVRKQIVAKAIVDPAFRARLLKDPVSVFQAEPTEEDLAALKRLRKFLPAMEDMVNSLAGEVLCGGGGGCGGLA
jgi:hypothetical protein